MTQDKALTNGRSDPMQNFSHIFANEATKLVTNMLRGIRRAPIG
jgi:hypothetical protein